MKTYEELLAELQEPEVEKWVKEYITHIEGELKKFIQNDNNQTETFLRCVTFEMTEGVTKLHFRQLVKTVAQYYKISTSIVDKKWKLSIYV